MRRYAAFMVSLLLILLIQPSVLAAEFSAYSDGSDKNRIFTLEIYLCDETASFCGVSFEVKYDKNILEYRGAHSAVSDSEINVHNNDSGLMAIFISDTPLNCKDNTKILGLDFISKSGGSGNFDITIYEAVDTYSVLMETNSHFLCPYSVTTSSDGSLTVSSTKSSNFKVTTSSNNKAENTQNISDVSNTDEDQKASEPNDTELEHISGNKFYYLILLSVLIIALTGLYISKIIRAKSVDNKLEKAKRKNDEKS